MRTNMKWVAVAVFLVAAPGVGHAADDEKALLEVPVGATFYFTANDAQREKILTDQTKAIVDIYGKTEDEDRRTKLRGELSTKVADHFDLRHERRAKELKELEEQVKRLRELQEQRLAQRDRIIKDRVESLVLEADGLGWGKDPGSNGPSKDPFTARPRGSLGLQQDAIEVPASIRQKR